MEQPRAWRSVDSDLSPLEEIALELLTGMSTDRVRRVTDEVLGRAELRLDVEWFEQGLEP